MPRPSSTSVRSIASSSAISSAAGLALPATSPSATMTRAVRLRQDVVEVAADRVGRLGQAERLDAIPDHMPSGSIAC